MHTSVIVATKDRHEDLKRFLISLKNQTIIVNELIIVDSSVTTFSMDIGDICEKVNYIKTDQKGLTVQRNIGLKNINKNTNYVFFFDDDIVLDEKYIENILDIYLCDRDNEIGGLGGYPLKDGDVVNQPIDSEPKECKSLYGCNMSYRFNAIKDMKFDENLSLYSWMEDWDFSYRVYKNGLKLYRVFLAHCYHLQSKESRINEEKLGFMLIANKHYLFKKNGIPMYKSYYYLFGQVVKNIFRIRDVRFRKRLKGNFIAIKEVVILGKNVNMVEKI